MARGFTQGWVEQGGNNVTTDGRTSITQVQRSYPEATVTVFNAGTAVLATIFSDEGGTPLANPFVADGDGRWGFWADQGRYDIQFSGAGIPAPYTYFSVDVVPSAATLPDPGSNGIVVRTALGTTVARSLSQPAAGITIANSNGVAGNPTFALANDLAAVEGLGTTGMTARIGVDTWATRTITGTANNITVTNGDGVAGNPTLNIGANVVTNTGGTVTDNALVRMDLTTGRVIQSSAVIVADTSGSFTVPNGWAVTNAGGLSQTMNQLTVAYSIPTGASAGPLFDISAAAQTQSSGTPSVVRINTTFNQTATAGSDSLLINRIHTAQGSGQHNFMRLTVSGTMVGRWDNAGNIYLGANPAIIGDVNGNEQLRFVPTASAVNEWTFTNAATGGTPSLTITGGDPNPNGRIAAKGTGHIIIPGYAYAIEVNTTIVGNVGGGLDTLHTYTLPAGSLATNGDFLEIWYSGGLASNDADKTLSLNFAGTNIINTGALDIDGEGWAMHVRVVRISSTQVRTYATITAGFAAISSANAANGGTVGGVTYSDDDTLAVADLGANGFVMTVQGTGTADNDVVQSLSIIKLTQRA